jgi:plastocyanin
MKAKLFVEPASATTSEADETAETGSTTTSKAVTSPTVPPTQTSPGSEQRAAVGTQPGEESTPAGSPPTTGNATTTGQGEGNATGQQEGQAGAGGGGGGGPTITILEGSSIQGNPDYDPDQLTVKKGDTIQVNNADTTMPHTVTNGESTTDPNSAKLFDTGIIMAGESAQLDTSNVDAGAHPYYCTVHPYMTGTLTVE